MRGRERGGEVGKGRVSRASKLLERGVTGGFKNAFVLFAALPSRSLSISLPLLPLLTCLNYASRFAAKPFDKLVARGGKGQLRVRDVVCVCASLSSNAHQSVGEGSQAGKERKRMKDTH